MIRKIAFKQFFTQTKTLLRNRNYNFYEVLGIERGCTNEEIKSAYLKLAKQYHPDINNSEGAEEKFKSITVAYEALNNQRNRDLYDSYMYSDPYSDNDHDFFRRDDENDKNKDFFKEKARWDKYYETYKGKPESDFWGSGNKNTRKAAYEEDVFKDFDSIFNYDYKKKEQKGQDIFLEISIPLIDSYFGIVKGVSIKNRKEVCKICKGSMCSPGFRPSKCFTCGGNGEVNSTFKGKSECKVCKGKGFLIKNPCK